MAAVDPLSTHPTDARRRATKMSIGDVPHHIREDTWPARAPHADVGPLGAWRRAEPVHWTHARRGAVTRYDRPTDNLLLARQGALVTVIELMDRPWRERIYVRNQVIR